MNAHIEDIPKPFKQVMTELPMTEDLEWLESIVLQCLEKDPADRFQTMRELMRAVEHGIAPSVPPARTTASRRVVQPVVQDLPAAPIEALPSPDPRDANRRLLVGVAITCGALFLIVSFAMVVFIYTLSRKPPEPNSGFSSRGAVKRDYRLYELEYPPVNTDKTDLRVLSVYNGQPDASESTRDEIVGNIEVYVTTEGKPQTLVLNSYMPTTWNIVRANHRVKIKKIVTVGYYPQKVKGTPRGTARSDVYFTYFKPDGSKSETPTHTNLFDPFHFLFLQDEDLQSDSTFAQMKSAVEKATGSHLRSFKGIRTTDRFSIY